MGDRGIGDQFLHIFLDQRHKADINHCDQRQNDHKPFHITASIRQDRQSETDESVCTQLQHDGGQNDRTARRRLNVCIRQPSMYRPHRNLDGKRGQHGDKQPYLDIQRQRHHIPCENIETVCLQIEVQNGDQHRQGTEKGIEEKLECRINTAFPSPDTNNDEHRYQRRFKENVEKQTIESRKNADHQTGQDQKSSHILRNLLLNGRPARYNHHQRHQCRQYNEPHRNTIHA